MRVVVVRETAPHENRVALVPDLVGRLTGAGLDVAVETGAGVRSLHPDEAYEAAGAAVTDSPLADADVVLSGPAAQFGRTGLVNEISKRLISEFVECLEAKLAATTVEAAAEVRADAQVNGLALFFSGLWAWIKRLFGRSE